MKSPSSQADERGARGATAFHRPGVGDLARLLTEASRRGLLGRRTDAQTRPGLVRSASRSRVFSQRVEIAFTPVATLCAPTDSVTGLLQRFGLV